MDIFLLSTLLLFIIFIVSSFYLHQRKLLGIKNLPPGSYGWPLVGESYRFLFKKHDHFLKERRKKYSSDIFKTSLLGEPTVIICGPSANKLVSMSEPKLVKVHYLKTQHRLFSIPKAKDHEAIQKDAEKTKAAVAVPVKILGFLKPEGLMKYMGGIESMIQQHFRTHWDGQKEVKVYPLMKDFSLRLILQFYLGLDKPDSTTVAKLATLFDDLFSGIYSIPVNLPGTTYHRAQKAASEIQKAIQMIIKEKIDALSVGSEVEKDLLTYIVGAQQDGKYVPKLEISNVIMGMMNSSYTSLAITLSFMIKHTGQSPEIYHKILSEHTETARSRGGKAALDWESIQKMKYTWAVVQETMRLYPTAPGAFRVAATDITFDGFTIPKGWQIFWAITATNMDPKYFREPEKFDPSRFIEGNGPSPYTFIPFGAGARTCPGMDYVRFAVLAFIHSLVTNFKWQLVFPHEPVFGALVPFPAQDIPIRLNQL